MALAKREGIHEDIPDGRLAKVVKFLPRKEDGRRSEDD
jgi:hypothetical protein